MALTSPGIAALPCSECAKFLYDIKTGKPVTRGDGEKQPRPQGAPLPCRLCPKKSPQEAHKYELSRKNVKALRLYLEMRATQGRCIPKRLARDGMFRRVMATIDQVMRSVEREQNAEAILAPLLIAKMNVERPAGKGRR
jgi:hypothetical protein